MKTRASKILAFSAVLVVATFAMNPAFADGNKSHWNKHDGEGQAFKIRFAGGFVQNIEQTQFDDQNTPIGEEGRGIALTKGRGTFGKVDIMSVTVSGPPSSDKPCPNGLTKLVDIVENNLVLTFSDLSLLYGTGTGVVCGYPDFSAPPIVEVDGTWDGGTGRFRRAAGTWSIEFDFSVPVGQTAQFSAETGIITGHITGLGREHRHDD